MSRTSHPLSALLAAALTLHPAPRAQDASPQRHDVVWDTPSADAGGSMPLGNGDIGLNAWIDPGGALTFYISKTDSWSDNGRLLKVGRLRITTAPPLPTSTGFEQRLSLIDGAVVIRGGDGADATTTRLWVDANHPVIHVTIDGERERTATATIDLWRTERTAYPTVETSDLLEDRSKPDRLHEPVFVEPDTLLERAPDRIGWYHFNRKSVGPAQIAATQGLSPYFEGRTDPLLHRIFGAVVTATGGRAVDRTHLESPPRAQHRFSIFVTTEHPSSPERWLERLDAQAAAIEQTPFEQRRAAHAAWWNEFWQRSFIHVTQRTGSDPVPRNQHPMRIGVDQHGGNRFVGELGRATVTARVATGEQVAALALDRQRDVSAILTERRFAATPAVVGAVVDSTDWTFAAGLTLEAWLRPGALPGGGGRIFDKVTPGGADGVLLDTHPGRSLRLIVGSRTVRAADVLPRDAWVHVAATVDAGSGALALYVDGHRVADDRSAGDLDDAATVGRAYALQRFVDACAGRGRYPIKFNGSIFTVPHAGTFGDADYRRWGPGYWWQNTRLPYLSMCASGDTEMMRPLFRMYAEELMPLHRYRTARYTGHAGAFIPECIYFWGPIFSSTYGWTPFAERGEDKLQDSGYHKWEWVSGLELVWMMLDYAEHTEDDAFVRDQLVPTARQVLTFFDQHYARGDDGKLVMHPSQALETWWDCTDPMPEVAGLRAVTARLLTLKPDCATDDERAFWRRVLAETPELPTWEKDGARLLAPAARFDAKRNVENPELYAVFPFRLVSFEKANVGLGVRALDARWDRGASGWRQDDLFMTHLGLGEQARANLVSRARNKHSGSRFPAFWGPNYDWIPDQDHGGVLMRTLQTMLVQTEGRAIHLLPAWPEEWDAEFELHAPYRTTVSGKVRDGRVVDLRVEPASRREDVVIHAR